MHLARRFGSVTGVLLAGALAGGTVGLAAEREMNVRQGPETVFDRSVADLVPQLQGATPTGQNGRVGAELVFWGYRLADGGQRYLFACAAVAGVDCQARIAAICEVRTEVLARGEHSGTLVRRDCRAACVAAASDRRGCCTDVTEQSPLQIGLVACR